MRESVVREGKYLRLVKTSAPFEARSAESPRILLVVDQLSTVLGGGERILVQMARLIPKYGFQVSVLALHVDPTSPALQNLTCHLYELSVHKTFSLSAIKPALELRKFLRAGRFVLVQTFFESSDIWVGGITKVFSSAKLVWSRRDMGILRSRKHEIAYRLMHAFPDLVFAVSEKVKHHCIEIDRVPADRVEVTYNGLDLSEYERNSRQRSRRTRRVTIATLGNIRRVKGHDTLVRAITLIADDFPECRFVIAGKVLEVDFAEEVAGLVKQSGLSERVRFARDVENQANFLKGIDIFVLPSRSEGFSNAIVEAMAAGLPVIATDVGGNAEAVVDGMTGRIVPPSDAAALADAMRDLLSDMPKAIEMGARGRERAESLFTIEAMMNRIVSLYKGLLQLEG